jgi:hypothetical protein
MAHGGHGVLHWQLALPSILWQAFCGANIAASLQVSDVMEVFELML